MKYTAYERRKETDKFFIPQEGSASFTSNAANYISYVESEQLVDEGLWAVFVEQFRKGNVDDFDNGWRCEYWGKMMRGACFTYNYTQNLALYKILENTVKDLLTTQDSLGRFSTYSTEHEFCGWDMWGRKYVLLGFQYFLEICKDDSLSDKIVKAMCRHADYIISKIGNTDDKIKITSTSEWWGGLNSCSILEPFVRLYDITAEKKYLDFAKSIIDAGGTKDFNIFEAALEGKAYPYQYPVTKAYEMISCFEGVIEYYRVTGEEKYLAMAVNFAKLLIESEITVIGSAGTKHEQFDYSVIHQFDPERKKMMQETCVTVTWMKFCYQLLCLTGDMMYADQIEKSIYNALIGAININKNKNKEGQIFTFDSYSPSLNSVRGRGVGGYKDIVKDKLWWGCCVAIGAAGTGLIPMVAVMPAKDGVAINLFLNGESTTSLPDGKLTLKTETDYPKGDNVRITVETDITNELSIYVRIPNWSVKTTLLQNEKSVHAKAGEYAVIKRKWKTGDVIELTLDMRVKIIRATELDSNADKKSACHAALRRGPVMLARDSQFEEKIEKKVRLVDNEGYAETIYCKESPFKCEQHYKIELEKGRYINVADYASCGQSWNKDLPMTVWLTTK